MVKTTTIYQFKCLGSVEGLRWLGINEKGKVCLQGSRDLESTKWIKHIVPGRPNAIAFEVAAGQAVAQTLKGDRWLYGHTSTGEISLDGGQRLDVNSGLWWSLEEIDKTRAFVRCKGTSPDKHWLNGLTKTGEVNLVGDGGKGGTGAKWEICGEERDAVAADGRRVVRPIPSEPTRKAVNRLPSTVKRQLTGETPVTSRTAGKNGWKLAVLGIGVTIAFGFPAVLFSLVKLSARAKLCIVLAMAGLLVCLTAILWRAELNGIVAWCSERLKACWHWLARPLAWLGVAALLILIEAGLWLAYDDLQIVGFSLVHILFAALVGCWLGQYRAREKARPSTPADKAGPVSAPSEEGGAKTVSQVPEKILVKWRDPDEYLEELKGHWKLEYGPEGEQAIEIARITVEGMYYATPCDVHGEPRGGETLKFRLIKHRVDSEGRIRWTKRDIKTNAELREVLAVKGRALLVGHREGDEKHKLRYRRHYPVGWVG